MAAPEIAPKQHRDIALAASLTAAEDALEDIGRLREWLAAWGADTFLTGKVNAMIVDVQYVRNMLGTMSGEPTPEVVEDQLPDEVLKEIATEQEHREAMLRAGLLPDPEPPF